MSKHEEKPEPGTDVEARRNGKSSNWFFKSVLAVSISINIGLGTWVANKVQTMSENIATLVAWKEAGRELDDRNARDIAGVTADVKDHERRISGLEAKTAGLKQP